MDSLEETDSETKRNQAETKPKPKLFGSQTDWRHHGSFTSQTPKYQANATRAKSGETKRNQAETKPLRVDWHIENWISKVLRPDSYIYYYYIGGAALSDHNFRILGGRGDLGCLVCPPAHLQKSAYFLKQI